MQFSAKNAQPVKCRSACLIVGIYEKHQMTDSAQALDSASNGLIKRLLRSDDIRGEVGEILLLPEFPNIAAERVLLVGCGTRNGLDERKFRKIIEKVATTLKEKRIKEAHCYLTELEPGKQDQHWRIQQMVRQLTQSLYSFDQLKAKKENRGPLKKLSFDVSGAKAQQQAKLAINEAKAISDGMTYCRDLGNLPSNICHPSYLAKQAQNMAKEYKAITTRIVDEAHMKKLGMGSLLAVSRGSKQPAKLICIHYKGAAKDSKGKDAKPIVLVGKGITFDTGGLSLKAPANMIGMKYDMCGGATVFGVIQACADLKLPLNVVGVIAAAENMPSGEATRPEDVVKSMSGQTIEILNTDAEGRLVLCDALTYVKRYKPDVVIDMATLTGAIIVALGSEASGLMSNHQPLADDLIAAGQQAGDRAWQLPIWEEYQGLIDSQYADMKNISNGMGAKSIVAGCFLARFTRDYRWAHLDIAGTASGMGPDRGSTGRPVPMIMQYLLNRAKKKN